MKSSFTKTLFVSLALVLGVSAVAEARPAQRNFEPMPTRAPIPIPTHRCSDWGAQDNVAGNPLIQHRWAYLCAEQNTFSFTIEGANDIRGGQFEDYYISVVNAQGQQLATWDGTLTGIITTQRQAQGTRLVFVPDQSLRSDDVIVFDFNSDIEVDRGGQTHQYPYDTAYAVRVP